MGRGQRECSESALDYLLLELVHHYQSQASRGACAAKLRAPCTLRAAGRGLSCPLSLLSRAAARSPSPGPPHVQEPGLPAWPLLPCAQAFGPPLAAAIDAVGLRVGRQLIERYTKDRPPLGDQLEVRRAGGHTVLFSPRFL